MSAQIDRLIEILQNARSLIEDPNHWIKNAEHRVKEEIVYKSRSFKIKQVKEYDAYCILGAIKRVAPNIIERDSVLRLMALKLHNNPWFFVPSFNDNPTTSHEDVLVLFDKVLADLKKKQYEEKRDALYKSVGELTYGKVVSLPEFKEEDAPIRDPLPV